MMQTQSYSSPVGGRGARQVTGRMVLACLVAFFAVIAAVNAVMIRAAVSTFGGVETESSYKAGLAFARDIAAAQAQDARHWQVRANVTPLPDGTISLELSVRDASGQPVSGLDAAVQLNHPTDRRLDRSVFMHEIAPGRFRGVTAVDAGNRDLVIDLTRGAEHLFRSKNRLVLG